jgi:hypothetical protein
MAESSANWSVGQQCAGFMAMNSGVRVFPMASTMITEDSRERCLIMARQPCELAAVPKLHRETQEP